MNQNSKQSSTDPWSEWFNQERGLEVYEDDDDVDEVETDLMDDRDLL